MTYAQRRYHQARRDFNRTIRAAEAMCREAELVSRALWLALVFRSPARRN